MSELYCLYQQSASPEAWCGPANIKTQQGLAVAAFATAELAEYFASVFSVKGRVVKLAELGTAALPLKPKPPVRVPKLAFVFSTKGVLSAWADDREGFDTAPHVRKFTPAAG